MVKRNVGIGRPTAPSSNPSMTASSHNNSKRDGPTIGTWEKHTKGIGMKLLIKMGYSGQGGLIAGSYKRRRLQQSSNDNNNNNNNNNATDTIDGSGTISATGHVVNMVATDTTMNVWMNDDMTPITTTPCVVVKTGIAVPVQVKVRPNNLGLGYGNFKEATTLLSNRQIESDVRGGGLIQPPGHGNKNTRATGSNSAEVSSYQQQQHTLLQQQSWKRRWRRNEGKNQSLHNSSKISTFVPYKELLPQQQLSAQAPMTIIDMRGPVPSFMTAMQFSSSSSVSQPGKDDVLLGDELSHNVSLLLNTYQTKLHAVEYTTTHQQRQKELTEKDLTTVCDEIKVGQERQSKLEHVLLIFDEIEQMFQQKIHDTNHHLEQQIPAMRGYIQQLLSIFTPEERQQLQLSQMLIPTLFGSIAQTAINSWDPLRDETNMDTSSLFLRSILLLNNTEDDRNLDIPTKYCDDMYEIRQSILIQYVLPKLNFIFDSSRWDPSTDQNEIGLNTYELLNRIVREEIHTGKTETETVSQNDDDGNVNNVLYSIETDNESTATGGDILASIVRKQLVHTVIYNKLSRSLLQIWKPQLNESKTGLMDRPDLWILPWLPHIADDKSLMPSLISDCKRTIKNAIVYLQRMIPLDQNDIYITACLQTLRPWCGIFKKDTLHGIMSSSVIPRLGQYLSRSPIEIENVAPAADDDDYPRTNNASSYWNVLDITLQFHCNGLLSDIELLSLIEGELLPHWANAVHRFVLTSIQKQADNENQKACTDLLMTTLCTVYMVWKFRILGSTVQQLSPYEKGDTVPTISYTLSHQILQNDTQICECFYGVLLMIRTINHVLSVPRHQQQQMIGTFNDLRASRTSYRTVLSRRRRLAKETASNDLFRMNESGTANGNGSTNSTKARDDDQATTNIQANGLLEARVRLQQEQYRQYGGTTTVTPSFRDVVEEFAREHDLLFQPRSGNYNTSTTKDGKQIFVLGTIPIYLDQNVAYALLPSSTITSIPVSSHVSTTKHWQPMSLDDIARMAQNAAEVTLL